ncbi:cytochrome c oxidase assembly protein [Nocardioides seonyuensis]|uniref:cytochrome c oxidase assembly protein n=1 Tax=Nocardioides seonyuensis TaxID=2518371 RepID=UPI00142486A8|nr:cytochrome c oxidase assembly protein [Nocardioides seonyuensis]
MVGALAPLGIVGLPDPGAATRVGLPLVQTLRDVAALTTVGALVLATTCVPAAREAELNKLSGAQRRLVALAQFAASAWALTSGLLIVLVYSDVSGTALHAPGFTEQAVFFFVRFELGRYALWGAGFAALVALGCAMSSRMGGVGVTTVIAVVGLWPIALTGHAAGILNHDEAVNLQMFHLLGIAVWMGGLVSLVVVRRQLGGGLGPTVRRYSTLAGWCVVLVTMSGLFAAWLRLPSIASVASPYGLLLGMKLTAVSALAGAGWWQRRRTMARLEAGDSGAFWWLVSVELAVLSGTAGLGVALSRTAPPAPDGGARPLTASESLLGRSLPEPLDAAGWFTSWDLDTLFLPLGVAGIAWYLWSVRRLRRRGAAWAWWRTTSWVVGCLLFLWATNGAPGAYGRVLFSMHMVQHMTIATSVPVFLVLGTPVTLALRTLRRRDDGSQGPREWLLGVVHALPVQLLGHPIVAAVMFVVSMVVFYSSSSLFEASLESHTAHVLMTLHFLLAGYLFAESVVGSDPGLRRPPYPLRVLLVMVTFGFHALFAVSLMATSTVLARQWFEALSRPWGRSLADDQYLGASLGWALGEYPLAVMAAALLVSWVRADGRERRRFDRREARGQDRELTAYNNYLGALARAEETRGATPPTMGRRSEDIHQEQGDRP